MLLNFISLYLFIAILVTLLLSAYMQTRGGGSYLKIILLLAIAICFYMYGYSEELHASSFDQILFWNLFQYIGIPFVSALWLTICLIYTGFFYPLSLWKILLVFAIPAATLVFRFTNSWFPFYFTSISYMEKADRLLIIKSKGPWYYVQTIHSGAMVLTTFILYTRAFLQRKKEEGPKVHYMLLASVFSVLGLIINSINPGQINMDFMVLFLPLAVISVILAVLRHDFLEIRTLARNMIFETSHDGMILLNRKNRIVDYNKAAALIFSLQGVQLKEEAVEDLLAENPDLLRDILSKEADIRLLHSKKDDQYYDILTKIIYRDNGSDYGVLKTIRNTTEKQILHNNLRRQAATDELSGLYNRREFMNICRKFLAERRVEGSEICLIMIDIDFFKSVNDEYGHSMGDFVIKSMGDLFLNNFRRSDIIGRLGGEEFAVFFESNDEDSSLRIAEKFRKTVESTLFKQNDSSLSITISVGLACCNSTQALSLDKLLQNADDALYESKKTGRNRTTPFQPK